MCGQLQLTFCQLFLICMHQTFTHTFITQESHLKSSKLKQNLVIKMVKSSNPPIL